MLVNKLGFMQGRLSPIYFDKIQSFPLTNWENEFISAKEIGFTLMEWTLDYDLLHQNPLLSEDGRSNIKKCSEINKVSIKSITGDCFMQAPFWKASGSFFDKLEKDFISILDACKALNISIIIIPLVDNGSIQNESQKNIFVKFLLDKYQYISDKNLKIAFESDFEPVKLGEFIKLFPSDIFGINYDTGNSAALGYKISKEFSVYSDRIINVHIKDRVYNGPSVKLGSGNVDFKNFFKELCKAKYHGNLILQTARSSTSNHQNTLVEAFEFVKKIGDEVGLLISV